MPVRICNSWGLICFLYFAALFSGLDWQLVALFGTYWSGLTLASGGAASGHIVAWQPMVELFAAHSLHPALRFGAVLGFWAVMALAVFGTWSLRRSSFSTLDSRSAVFGVELASAAAHPVMRAGELSAC